MGELISGTSAVAFSDIESAAISVIEEAVSICSDISTHVKIMLST